MTRIAHCCCGSLCAEVSGEPALVAACHCMECQRRTGSPFGVSTYFLKEHVRTEGPSKVYVRGSDSGRKNGVTTSWTSWGHLTICSKSYAKVADRRCLSPRTKIVSMPR
jgi:hypothetical protein